MALSYVGGNTGTGTGATYAVSLTALTGGSDSSAAVGDLVIVCTNVTGTTDVTFTAPTGFTKVADLYGNDTRDCNLGIFFKYLTAADTSVTVTGSNNAANGGATVVHVWRGAEVEPFLYTSYQPVTATGNNGANADCPSVTPHYSSFESVILAVGAGTGATTQTAPGVLSGYSNLKAVNGDGSTMDGWVAICSKAWVSGAEDPAAYASGASSNSDSWCAATLVLCKPTPKVGTLAETFNSVSAPTGWATYVGGTGGSTYNGTVLEVRTPALNDSCTVTPDGLTDQGAYFDLTESAVYAKFVRPPQGLSSGDISAVFVLQTNELGGCQFRWLWSPPSDIVFQWAFNNAYTTLYSATYSSTTHAWLKISESGGTVTCWSAPDNGDGNPGTWVSRGTITRATAGFPFTRLEFDFAVFNFAGSTTGGALWDGVNTVATYEHLSTGALAGPGAVLGGRLVQGLFDESAVYADWVDESGYDVSVKFGGGVAYRIPTQGGPTSHATSGALTGAGATLAGTASRTRVHATTGALTGPGATLAGTAQHKAKHTTTGVLVGPGATLAGTAARTRVHATTSVLAGTGASLAGTAQHKAKHTTTGVLAGAGNVLGGAFPFGLFDESLVAYAWVDQDFDVRGFTYDLPGTVGAGAARRFRAHTTSGALAGAGASLVGVASRTRVHSTSGVLVAAGATLSGTSHHKKIHATSGVLAAAGATLSGTASRTAIHATSGTLAAAGPTLAGTAQHKAKHTTSGTLAAAGATLSGTASRLKLHATSGVLAGAGATLAGTATHISVHATSGALVGVSALSGTATRSRIHTSSGVLASAGPTLSGTAGRFSGHVSSGALTGGVATLAGTAQHLAKHATSGTLAGQGANVGGPETLGFFDESAVALGWVDEVVARQGSFDANKEVSEAGIARRFRTMSASGALAGAGATLAGTSHHKKVHATSGALTGGAAAVSGAAARTRVHATAGVLSGAGAVLVGAAQHKRKHATSGVLSAGQGIIVGQAVRGNLTHVVDGALVGIGAILAGVSAHNKAHISSGVLAGYGAIIVGAAVRPPHGAASSRPENTENLQSSARPSAMPAADRPEHVQFGTRPQAMPAAKDRPENAQTSVRPPR